MVLAFGFFPVRPAVAQQYVGRFSVYGGYMFLDSPGINLFEPGFHVQAGVRAATWMTLGVDYSRSTGDTVLTPNLATTALQQQLTSYIDPLKAAGLLPGDYVPSLPLSSTTQTFAAGPEFPIRRFNRITPYIRPSCGLIREDAVGHPNDVITKAIMAQIAPTGTKQDWAIFYGFGGGVALNFSKHFSLIVQADFVHDHLFGDLLRNGRNTVRFSVGPGFQFGHNIRE